MRKILFILLSVNLFINVQAQKGTNYEVEAFNAVEVHNSFKVFLTQGDKYSVVADIPEDQSENLVINVKSQTLIVTVKHKNGKNGGSWKNNSIAKDKMSSTKIYITCPTLNSIDVSGAVSLAGQTAFKVDRLDIDLSGSSKVNLEVLAEKLNLDLSGSTSAQIKCEINDKINIDLSGASQLSAAGHCITANIDCSGASSIHGEFLNIGHVNIATSGASSVKLGETKVLDAEATGASSINYRGTGIGHSTKVNIEKSGSSSVNAY